MTPELWINIAAPVKEAIEVIHQITAYNIHKVFETTDELRSINSELKWREKANRAAHAELVKTFTEKIDKLEAKTE